MEHEDMAYIRQVLANSPDAYDHLVRKYMNAIYFFIHKRVKHHEDAKDLTQETFIRAYHNLKRYKPEYKFLTWLCQIAANLCNDEFRKRKRRKTTVQEEIDAVDHLHPESLVLQNEDKKQFIKKLKQLPPLYREVLVLRFHHELSYKEIGQCLEQRQRGAKHLPQKILSNQTKGVRSFI
ncbi:RNA polymerase sigma factor [Laceyella putida]|uniref:RNA polymerase sigma factor n=1 Tax=Laceyella putida TaxID=110101 RepID=A0ABW2RFV2_9BACL